MSSKRCSHCKKIIKNGESEGYGYHNITSERRGAKSDGYLYAAEMIGGRTFNVHFELCYKCLDSEEWDFEL